MAQSNLIKQMLEHLVNGEQTKAEELFHDYVIEQSRSIYESLIEAELDGEQEEDEDEYSEAYGDEEDENTEGKDDFDFSAENEEDAEDKEDSDPTDQLANELEAGESEEEEDQEEEIFQDLEDIVDQLQAKFDELKGLEQEEHDLGGEEEDEEGPATMREYVERVEAGHGAEKKGKKETAENTKSVIDNMKNDMGGTTANILSSKAKTDTSGPGLAGKPSEMKTGNINVPGAKAGKTAFTKNSQGHGAEKKGASEGNVNSASLFRSRR